MAGLLWARGPYRIAVCGVSRNSEELEMALELNSKILVQKCGDKNLDATFEVTARYVEAYSESEVLFSEKHEKPILSEKRAKQLVARLLTRLMEKPKQNLTPLPPLQQLERGSLTQVQVSTQPVEEQEVNTEEAPPLLELLERGQRGEVWQLETLASLDQWNSRLSTQVYPGLQIRSAYTFAESWILEGRLAFGTSAFRVVEQIAWNQQLLANLALLKNFELLQGFNLGPQMGYFYWGSFSEVPELPSFQRHDLKLGFNLAYEFKTPSFEIETGLFFLPVHLGMQAQVGFRYYFVPSWYLSLQGWFVNLWANNHEGSFLSASAGLGCSL